jgi:hypothetical protein
MRFYCFIYYNKSKKGRQITLLSPLTPRQKNIVVALMGTAYVVKIKNKRQKQKINKKKKNRKTKDNRQI